MICQNTPSCARILKGVPAVLNVLLVDDDVNVAQCIRQVIPWDDIGCQLIGVACNGLEGYNMAVELQPDIIICDLVMPVMDGAALCQRVFETMSDVSFIFLSAYEDFTTAQLAMKYHVLDYIIKPIGRDKIDYLSGLLEGIRQRSESNNFYMRLLYDRGTHARIDEALGAADLAYFQGLFQRFSEDITASNLDINHIRNVVYSLLNRLYDFLEGRGVDCVSERRETFEQLKTFRFKMDLVFVASERYFQHLRPESREPYSCYRSLTRQIEAYIDERFADPMLGVSAVAAHFSYSGDYLGRVFNQHAGRSITEYIARRRMEHGARLLRDTGLPVGDVARQSGYLSASYFARVFRKYHGLSPVDYRAKHASGRRRSE